MTSVYKVNVGLVIASLHGPQHCVLVHLYFQETSVTLVSITLGIQITCYNHFSTESVSMSYTGNGYAHYTLTEEGTRQRRQTEEGGETRSTYNDIISFSLRTTYTDGLLFAMYDKTESEYLYITVSLPKHEQMVCMHDLNALYPSFLQLELGEVVLYLNLGESTETSISIPGPHPLNDSLRHSVVVERSGHYLNLTVDSISLQHTLPLDTPLTLDIHTSEIYTGGSPYIPITSWFIGCLQDVRINRLSLPTVDENEIASVTYEGVGDNDAGITEGCSLSPCYRNPCGSEGICVESSNDSYQCLCSSGQIVTTTCPQSQEEVEFIPYVIAAAILAVLVTVSIFITIGKSGNTL